MGKLLLGLSFVILTPCVLLLSILYFSLLYYQNNQVKVATFSSPQHVAYAALPSTQHSVAAEVKEVDARVERLKEFLSYYGSPLVPFAQDIINVADFYKIDFRLIPAIAMQESNLCKKAPKNSYNCWGYGIYGKKITRFKNYKDGIVSVTKTLARTYKSNGLESPEEIMTVYAPSNNGSWAESVLHFMNKL